MTFIRTLLISVVAIGFATLPSLADPALYAVSDEDTTIYVLGTFHLLPPGAKWRSEAIDQALDTADAVYFEADVWGADPAVMQATVIEHGLYSDGSLLSQQLSPEDWNAVAAFGAGLGLPPQSVDTMRPWFAAVTFTTVVAMSRGDMTPAAGADASLYAELRAAGRDLRFFETFGEQMSFLSSFSDEVQHQMLMETVLNSTEAVEQFDDMYANWIAGDLDALDALGNGAMRNEYPAVYDAIIVDRNKRWIDELSELMGAQGTFFVAVGALHLPGPDGVLDGLEAEGFSVSQQ